MSRRARSPVLGYNHNLRYGGRVFHVQTEDSGQAYARLYTHLFYQGTILSSKKEQYDPDAPEDSVRALMQKLHKMMIRELTHAEHDARIAAFFTARGEPAMLEPPRSATPEGTPAEADGATGAPVVVDANPTPVTVPAAPPIAVAEPPAVIVIGPGGPSLPSGAPAAAPRPQVTPKPVVIVQPTVLKRSPVQVSNPADGVVVRRNVVVNVGAGQPQVKGPTAPAATPAPAAAPRARAGAHYAVREGNGFVSGNRARAPEASPQPLASTREIRMPWETPAPTRISQPVAPPVSAHPAAEAPVVVGGKIRMPWDPPSPTVSDAFAAELISDKSLDEVILEYLADDSEPEGR